MLPGVQMQVGLCLPGFDTAFKSALVDQFRHPKYANETMLTTHLRKIWVIKI